MRKKLFVALMLAVSFTFFFSPAMAGTDLSDKEAKAWLDNEMNNHPYQIKLGVFELISDLNPDACNQPGNRVCSEHYRVCKVLEKVGLIKISQYLNYEQLGKRGKDFWAQRMYLDGNSIVGEFTVVKTDTGEALAKKGGFPQKDGYLVLRQGTFRVDKIIRNELKQEGIDYYRILMATYTAAWTPELKQFNEIRGNKLSEKRKVMLLIKYDSFSATWKGVAADLANQDEDFKTNNVQKQLAPPWAR